MKKFHEGGEYFVLSSYECKAVPMTTGDDAGMVLAKTICDDACSLSAAGTGQTSIEFLRIAEGHPGGRIRHLLTLRTHDPSEQGCVTRQEAICSGLLSMLRQAGYVVEELTYEGYKQHLSTMDTQSVWALRKQDVCQYGMQGDYISPSIVQEVDHKRIYSALDGSGCSLCILITPTVLSDREHRLIAKNAAQCTQAVDGVVPNLRDGLAAASAERWKHFIREAYHPFAEVDLLVCGARSNAALVTARISRAASGATFQTVPVPDYRSYGIHNLPWKLSLALRQTCPSVFGKWTSDEAAKFLCPPAQQDYFIGIEADPFSLLPETELLPDRLLAKQQTAPSALPPPPAHHIRLGTCVCSDRDIVLPFDQFLLHTAVLGKSGSGKTTLLKQLISQFHAKGIPVLVMEPVKREYRDMVAAMDNSRIFTVERPVTPLLINPFCVPKGVTLGQYRSSLLSAFKAVFSLPDPLPSLFEKAISEVYVLHGWSDSSTGTDPDATPFDMADFIRIFKRIIARSRYSNEVKGNMMSGGAFRLQSLIERCPHTFDTVHSTSVEDLLSGCTVLEMGDLEPEQKSLVSALTLIGILAYLKATRTSGNPLRNIILIDEAHALLDRGEGATLEEKSLNSTMTQLMINIITEIRAYGVGVIFSDQSPSRVGGQMLDNVDNILSFRLSGQEAELLQRHMGVQDSLCQVLPLMSTGRLVLKNRFLRGALPLQLDYDAARAPKTHATDRQIARRQQDYLSAHAGDYRPFSSCPSAGCDHCDLAVREQANKLATQLFARWQPQLNAPNAIAAQLLKLPNEPSLCRSPKALRCTAIHLLRKCSLENSISFAPSAIETLLSQMERQPGKES